MNIVRVGGIKRAGIKRISTIIISRPKHFLVFAGLNAVEDSYEGGSVDGITESTESGVDLLSDLVAVVAASQGSRKFRRNLEPTCWCGSPLLMLVGARNPVS